MENKKQLPNLHTFSLPSIGAPVFSEAGKKDWITYGEDNLYPIYLIELLNNSSKHNAIVKRKTDLSVGGGWVQTNEFIDNTHGSEDLNDIVYKHGYDLNVYGAFAMLITWSKNKKSIARIKYVDLSKVRIAKEFDEKTKERELQDDGVDFYWISEDWSNIRKDKYKPQLIQGFSEKYKKDALTQLVYVKEYRPQVEYYTLPDYIASMDWISLDKEIANFHLNSVHNGFTPSMIINFNQGVPTPEEQNQLYKSIQKKYGGTDNASKVFITFSEGGDKKPDFVPIALNDSDERFLMLEEHIAQNITTGHRIPPIIAGIMQEGKLGSTDEIIEQEKLFQSQVISGKQKLIERCYNKLYNINVPGEKLELEIVTTYPDKSVGDVIEQIIEE
jgi:hypothetical protein